MKLKQETIIKDFTKITSIILVNMIHPLISILIYIGLIRYSINGKVESIKALILSFTIYFLNPGMFKIEGSIVPILRWVLFFLCVATILRNARKSSLNKKWILIFILWVIYVFIISLIKSNLPLVSISKLFMFVIGFISVSIAIDETSKYYDWRRWILTYIMVIEWLSLPLLVLPIGYFRNGSGFQGILNQPNAFGIITSVIVCLLIYFRIDSEKQKYSNILDITILISIVLLLSSKSRTSMLSLALGVGIIIVVFIKKIIINKCIKLSHMICIMMFSILISMVCIFNYTYILQSAKDLIFKGGDTNILSSSQNVITKEYDAINNSPIVGNGFGVDWYPDQEKSFEISLSHPVEKRNIALALMSETGIIGTIIFTLMIVEYSGFFVRRSISYKDSILMSLIVINFGEMVFFSGNGIGMFVWVMLAFYRCQK